jgi:hypothetical protein
MTNKKKYSKKRIGIIVALVAFIAFSIHFWIVTTPLNEGPSVQLGRIDFQEQIDSTEAAKITTYVKSLEGIRTTYFNIPGRAFVFGYATNTNQTIDNVFKQVMTLKAYKATRYVSDNNKPSGCPVMNEDSFFHRFFVYYYKVIKS